MTKQEIIDKVEAIKKAIENKEYDFYYDEIDTVSIEILSLVMATS